MCGLYNHPVMGSLTWAKLNGRRRTAAYITDRWTGLKVLAGVIALLACCAAVAVLIIGPSWTLFCRFLSAFGR